jgi:hypothetical protein
MFRFTDYISPLWFFIALFISLLFVHIMAPKKNIVVKEVNLSNHQDLVFRRQDQSCYRYKKEETKCS